MNIVEKTRLRKLLWADHTVRGKEDSWTLEMVPQRLSIMWYRIGLRNENNLRWTDMEELGMDARRDNKKEEI